MVLHVVGKGFLFFLHLLYHLILLAYQLVFEFQDTPKLPFLYIVGIDKHKQAEAQQDDQAQAPAE